MTRNKNYFPSLVIAFLAWCLTTTLTHWHGYSTPAHLPTQEVLSDQAATPDRSSFEHITAMFVQPVKRR